MSIGNIVDDVKQHNSTCSKVESEKTRMASALDTALSNAVLRHLRVPQTGPSLELLDALVAGYVRTVPWESAFRIVRRARTNQTEDCPRWPEQFWQDALERGGGGTCFESNYAFFALLRSLGFHGYLTINDMGESIGCHTAIVIELDGARWLVDVGLPLHVPLPLTGATAQREGPLHTYTVQPEAGNRYTITRDRHGSPYCYTLVDTPVDDADYRGATINDYGPDGLFLNRVIVSKIIDERLWRFNSDEKPLHLQRFDGETRVDLPLDGDPSLAIGDRFGMDVATVREALSLVDVR